MFQITEAAARAIAELAKKREVLPKGLRVGLRAGGCTGFEYVFEWMDSMPQEPGSLCSADEIPVFCDTKSLVLLEGATLDYEKTLMKSGFKWINPKQSSSCSCGKSVNF